MNQLTPPPERDLPARRHTQIRRALTRHVSPTARPSRSLRTPVLAAGAVVSIAAVSMVGFSAWPGGDSTGSDPRTGQRSEPSVTAGGPQTVTPVEWCRSKLASFYSGPFRAGPGISSEDGTVQVMEGSGQRWWACMLPGLPEADSLGSSRESSSDDVGEYTLGGDIAPDGKYLHGAGRVPEGIDSVRFTFPNGDVEKATIEDGYWLMTYRGSQALPLGVEINVEAGGRSWTIQPDSWGCSIWDDEGNTVCPELDPDPDELRENAERG